MCTVGCKALGHRLNRRDPVRWVARKNQKGEAKAMEQRSLEPWGVSDELRQQIAKLAFQLYEARGREDGRDMEDWLRAEAVLRREALLPRASIAAAVYED